MYKRSYDMPFMPKMVLIGLSLPEVIFRQTEGSSFFSSSCSMVRVVHCSPALAVNASNWARMFSTYPFPSKVMSRSPALAYAEVESAEVANPT